MQNIHIRQRNEKPKVRMYQHQHLQQLNTRVLHRLSPKCRLQHLRRRRLESAVSTPEIAVMHLLADLSPRQDPPAVEVVNSMSSKRKSPRYPGTLRNGVSDISQRNGRHDPCSNRDIRQDRSMDLNLLRRSGKNHQAEACRESSDW